MKIGASERAVIAVIFFSPVMLHTEKMSDEKKIDRRDRLGRLTMRRTNVPPWVYVSFYQNPQC